MVTIDELIEKIRAYKPGVDIVRIQKAFDYAKHSLRGVYRVSGDPALIHALEVTENLLTFNPDENSIIAAILHDVSKTADYNPKEISDQFGDDVAFLVVGMEKLQSIHLKGGKSDLDAFRRMLLSLAKDLRLVHIRFADLLHDVESLDFVPLIRRKEVAREILEVYAPIASRLGIYSVKCRLEDLGFKYLYPDKYEDIRVQLELYVRKQEKFLERVKNELTDFLKEQKIEGRVEGRLKNLYSIYTKMKRKSKMSLNEIYDIFAFRIILPTKYIRNGVENTEKLYTLLGLVHSHWTPLADRFKDYIAVPKSNGYRSLHTTLIGDEQGSFDQPFEVQIRSEDMHQQAEYGFASHWLYEDTRDHSGKVDGRNSPGGDFQGLKSQRHQDWLDGLVSLQRELAQGKVPGGKMKLELFQDHLFVFTPDGDVKDLPLGSTPVDFAYAVDADTGNRCNGARVNGAIVPLDYQLKNGDHVEIVTRSKSDPKPHWLSFVKSVQAKAGIKSYFKGLDTEQSFKEGETLVNRHLQGMELPLLDDNLSIFRQYGQQKLSLKERVTLVEDVGNGALNVSAVMKKVFAGTEFERLSEKGAVPESKIVKKSAFVNDLKENEIFIAGEKDVPYRLSSCCKPKPGDSIIGYVTRGNAVRIHRQSCKFLCNGDPNRALEASWGLQIHKQRLTAVAVKLRAVDRVGLIRDIASTVADFCVNIVNFTLDERRDDFIYHRMVMEVENDEQCQKILKRLRTVRNVVEVSTVADHVT
jgi:GTP pyrophosphokinase